jgi:plasmid stabilization system protein ParE
MNYTVVWQPPALAALARLWTNAPDRNAVAAASDSIDVRLARDPLSQGESRDGLHRVLFVAPLVVDFEVREAERTVIVLRVRHTRW